MNRIGTAAGGRLMTAMPTAFGAGTMGGRPPVKVKEGEFTTTVYTLINEQKYEEVKFILQNQLDYFPESRAALSLYGYVQYMLQDFQGASVTYQKLVKLYPDDERYKIYHAQSLHKAGLFVDAIKASSGIESEEHSQRLQKLKSYIHYEQDDLTATKAHAEKCLQDDPETIVLQACILYKEGDFEGAKKKFTEAMNVLGYKPHIAYNIALCSYRLKQYPVSLKTMQEIIEKGIREHPELSVGSANEGFEVRSVGNSQTLKDTALVEAFNLKCAIMYMMKNFGDAKDALKDMPPRTESELDAVTLHNQALLQMEDDPTIGFKKLKYLIQNPPFPPETFANLLILYCKHSYYYMAADILAENDHLSFNYLSAELYDFLEALILAQTSAEEAYRKFDELATKHVDYLRKLTKMIQDARISKNAESLRSAMKDFEDALEAYIPVLMAMAKIYWDIENYPKVEKILMESEEFCSEHDAWKLNLAHVYFMQENKFKDAIKFYEPIVEKQKDRLLEVPAMVLANLCVSYIMTSQNEDAEEWMRNIEKEEEVLGKKFPDKQSLHLCIVNLVIGTLYCSKGHYEFGISRVMKSLEPYNKKIMTDTWFYSKRCFLSLIETLSKHMIVVKDAIFNDILAFLEAAALCGKEVRTAIAPNAAGALNATDTNVSMEHDGKEERTVTNEARLLKRMFLMLRE